MTLYYGAKNSFESGSITITSQRSVPGQLELRLRLMGSVEGRIVDADGDPLADTNVVAIREEWRFGRRYLVPSSTITDERGRYRLSYLEAAKYFVYAEPNSPFLSLSAENIRTYYPSAPALDGANALLISEGEAVREADIRVIRANVFHIRGLAIGSDLSQGGKVRMAEVGEESNTIGYRDYRLAADGSFDISDVSPGRYTITIFSNSEAGSTQCEISSSDVAVNITLFESTQIQGRIYVDGSSSGAKLQGQMPTIELMGLHALQGVTYSARAEPSGRFQVSGVRSGKYLLEATSKAGFFVKALTVGGKGLDDDELDLTNGESVNVDILLSRETADIVGSVDSNSHGGEERAVQVLLLPLSKRHTASIYVNYADGAGRFSFSQVQPGMYRVLATEPLRLETLRNPSLAEKIGTLGQEVDLEEGRNKTVSLDLVPSDVVGRLVATSPF